MCTTLAMLLLLAEPAPALTVSELYGKCEQLNGKPVRVSGVAIASYTCPPCPPDARCKPCAQDHFTLGAGPNQAEKRVAVLTGPLKPLAASPRKLEVEARVTFNAGSYSGSPCMLEHVRTLDAATRQVLLDSAK
jgi:hypothetical protein